MLNPILNGLFILCYKARRSTGFFIIIVLHQPANAIGRTPISMPDRPPKLLVIFGDGDARYQAAVREVIDDVVDSLRERLGASATVFGETSRSGKLPDVLRNDWTHLIVAAGHDEVKLAEQFADSLLSSFAPVIIIIADGESLLHHEAAFARLESEKNFRVWFVKFGDSAYSPAFGERRAASEIMKIITGIDVRSFLGKGQQDLSSAGLEPETNARTSGTTTRPEPASLATLLARRSAANIERFSVPQAGTGRPDPSSRPRYSRVEVDKPGRNSMVSREPPPPAGSAQSVEIPTAPSATDDLRNVRAALEAERARAEIEATRHAAERRREREQERELQASASMASASAPRASESAPMSSGPMSSAPVGSAPPPSSASPRSASSPVVKWLLLGTAAALLGAFLYRRDLAALITPLFGSMVPPAAPPDPLTTDSSEPDKVELAAFGPASCSPGETILVQALLNLPTDRPAATALAVAADAGALRKAVQTLSIPLRHGEELAIDLEAEGCHIDEPRQATTWQGEPAAVQLFVTIPGDRVKPVPVRIVAMRAGIPVGSVRFMIQVAAGAAAQPIELRGEEAKRFGRAFVSYASEDRTSVLGYVQALSLTGIEIFQDVLSLEPGERWEQSLYKEIDRSDLFILFWSNAASRSKWVVAEAEYALRFADRSDSQSPVIRPFLLEGPPIPTIPDSLKSIHFNDKFRYMILGSKVSADALRNAPPLN